MARAARPPETREPPDALAGAPLPRQNTSLVGHGEAERILLDAYRSGRMHHGWLIAGEHGIGKATLAFRLARFVFAHPDPASPEAIAAADLSVAADHPAARKAALGTHADLLHLQREWDDKNKRYRMDLGVGAVRRVIPFLGTTAGEGGWRIVIGDPADEMTTSAANALLKNLEEPPRRTLFLLLTESAGSLPPTIRSRCRVLPLKPLGREDMERVMAELGVTLPSGRDRAVQLALAGGRPRKLIELVQNDGAALYRLMLRAVEKGEPEAQLKLSAAAPEGYRQVLDLLLGYLHRRVRGEPEADPGASPPVLPLVTWAELWEKASVSGLEVEEYNLDRRQFLLELLETVSAAASRQQISALG